MLTRLTHTLILAFLLANMPIAVTWSLDDAERSEKTEELSELRNRIHAMQRELEQTRNTHDQVRDELRNIELQINHHVKELNYINHRLRKQVDHLHALKAEQKRYEKDLAVQQQLLKRQLRTAYIIGRQEYLKLILNQQDPSSAGRSFAYYNYFSQARSQRLQLAKQTLEKLEQTKINIANERERLSNLAVYAREQKSKLESASQSRVQIVARLQVQIDQKGSDLSRLLDDEKNLRQILDIIDDTMPELATQNTQRIPFAKLKGKLNWPVKGKIAANFGKARNQSNVKWNGVMIRAPEGRAVQAVSYGRVAYADWLRGYGLLIIIDHGDGYMSLYAHNQSLYKEPGDWVKSGEQIARVGTSGGQSEPALYFEVRLNGKPSNPLIWCKRG